MFEQNADEDADAVADADVVAFGMRLLLSKKSGLMRMKGVKGE